jgi:hypothetical protein
MFPPLPECIQLAFKIAMQLLVHQLIFSWCIQIYLKKLNHKGEYETVASKKKEINKFRAH